MCTCSSRYALPAGHLCTRLTTASLAHCCSVSLAGPRPHLPYPSKLRAACPLRLCLGLSPLRQCRTPPHLWPRLLSGLPHPSCIPEPSPPTGTSALRDRTSRAQGPASPCRECAASGTHSLSPVSFLELPFISSKVKFLSTGSSLGGREHWATLGWGWAALRAQPGASLPVLPAL
ncbi:uncharacterized protein LOC115834223 [Nomascus leucogenys]|uniref:uncharacterized protein LOC115834223 n=1 Tax=Nomascus leucogenys TaxID=61853 RepID=UPI00122D5CF4|nr:uncharacterized protein LOC115834223 [Nomascus leucogenys]